MLTANINATETQYWDDTDDNGNGLKYDDPNDALLEATQAGIRLGQIAVTSLMEILMEKTIRFPI